MASVTPIKAAAKKTPMKKRRKLPAPRVSGPVRAKKNLAPEQAAALKMASLPPGFVADGFEIIGDQVRVYGKVKHPIDRGPEGFVTMVHSELYPDLVGRDIIPAPVQAHPDSPLSNALGSLERRIEEMGIALNELERTACSILLPAAPDVHPNSAGTAAVVMEAPAIDELHRLTNCLERLVNRVNNITGRVQA